MVDLVSDITVVGGRGDKVLAVTQEVSQDDQLKLGSLRIHVLQTPCHTRAHVLYLVSSDATECACLFTGDTLFSAGCGRFFEVVKPTWLY